MPKSKKAKLLHTGSKDVEEPHRSNENIAMKDTKDGLENLKRTYEVFFLGIVPEIVMSNSLTRDKEAQIVDRIEEAQIEGKLPLSAGDDLVKLNISIHGIKVMDKKGLEVLQRHPLHTLAQVVQYNEGIDVNNIVFKIGQVNKPVFSAYVFQCNSEEQAQMICQNMKGMFDYVRKNDIRTIMLQVEDYK